MPFFDVPGVYPRVLDESQFSRPTGSTPCAVVGAFAKGPITPFLITSVSQLYTLYGKNDPTIGFAGYCGVAALGGEDLSAGLLNPRGTTQLWVRRAVHSDALFAVTAESNAGSGSVSAVNVTTAGSNYTLAPVVVFTGANTTPATATANLTPTTVASIGTIVSSGTYTSAPGVVITPSDGNGSGAVATAVLTVNAITSVIIDAAGSGYTAPPTVTFVGGGGGPSTAVAVLTGTSVASITVTDAGTGYSSAPAVSFTGGGGGSLAAATAILGGGSALVPDGSGVADPLARAFGGSESFIVYPIGPGAYTNSTMSVEIANVHPDVPYTTWVTGHVYAVNAVVLHSGTFYICAIAHTSGTFSSDLTAVDWVVYTDLSWDLKVYAESDFVNPVEVFRCSKTHKLDGFGRQLYMQDAVNPFSQYVRVLDNPLVTTGPSAAVAQVKFVHGVVGSALSDSDIVTGWGDFQDVDKYPMRIMINAGYSTPAVQEYMTSLAAARFDCVAILDVPTASQVSSAAVTYRNSTLNLNSSFGAMFTPDYYTLDRNRGTYLYIPPSGAVARAAAYTDSNFDVWFPFAGVDRGQIPDALLVRQTYQPGDKALLYNNQVNYIQKDGAYGIYIDGNRTMQVIASALQSIHVRRLVNLLLVEGAKVLKVLKFELNSAFTRKRAVDILTTLYLPVKRAGGLYDFFIQCDSTNNPPDAIDRDELHIDAFIKPVRDVEFIVYTIIINRTGVILPTQQ